MRMRFDIKKINTDVYKVIDWLDEDNPFNRFWFSKKDALKIRDWLSENTIKLSFEEGVKRVIDRLWDGYEIYLKYSPLVGWNGFVHKKRDKK